MIMRSNVEYWKEMQAEGYFENHPCYRGLVDMGDSECHVISWFTPLTADMRVVVIGCGYGRESLHIARRVGHVYGIDVSEVILDKARLYTRQNGVYNFTPVLADTYRYEIPSKIHIVFSIAVMQHITRDLAKDYVQTLGPRLTENGRMVIQFLEELEADLEADAELRRYEPSVSWNPRQIVQLARSAGLEVDQIRSIPATPAALWHWAGLKPNRTV